MDAGRGFLGTTVPIDSCDGCKGATVVVAGSKLVVNARVVGFLNAGDPITEDEQVPRGRCGVALEGGAVVVGTSEQLHGLGGVLTTVYDAEVIEP